MSFEKWVVIWSSDLASAPPKVKPKGASLANPNKKARKYQAVEFESDEE